ncbi:MAG: acyl-CoA thioesterase [Rhizobiaceae bacterium]
MKTPIETHRSFVNSWECDENVHMNIQFYWKRFAEAAQIFFHLAGAEQQNWLDRHVRYHGELMMGTNTVIHSAPGPGGGSLVHKLVNGDTNALSATAIDIYPQSIGGKAEAFADFPEPSKPRSLPVAPLEPQDTAAILRHGLGLVTHRCIVTPQECDAAGNLLDQYQIARFSDAASHLWQFKGVTREWMRQENVGTVAVEMKASRHQSVRAGTMMEVVTWVQEVRPRTFTFRHQVSDMKTGQALYSGAVTALLLDLAARKTIQLPASIAATP